MTYDHTDALKSPMMLPEKPRCDFVYHPTVSRGETHAVRSVFANVERGMPCG